MKASAISLPLPLFSLFASLSSSLSIRDLLPRQGEEIKDLASTTIWPPEKPPPVDDVTFSWCQTYNQSDTCFSRDLKHGWCYDFRLLDPAMLDMLEDVGASGGQCMLFSSPDCKGKRTAIFAGEHLWTSYLCPKPSKKVKWNRDARSVRCCSGPPNTPWCNNAVRKTHKCFQ
ncbi:hypothetical protein ACSS6W_008983 [Trichoderma asperelloides]|uniref:Uncharacterized protein n=1 Tax=Trichoderma asperellum TaxID=101201 RepID=A0A6V8QTI3_TRIAP|nr:hypothetical protein LI328DRAFT_145838 [Trichoderma asperelloides]GFP55645.1 hypothetical protein TASIC1_0005050300 [Trichoderma asperellum]